MLRRLTSLAAAFLLLVAMTRVADRFDPDFASTAFYIFFLVELALTTVGMIGTERGYFGPRRHPVNRMFITFSWVCVLGALLTMVVQGVGAGNPLWLLVIGGASMFTGGIAGAVLAVSASPWRDLLYSRQFDPERTVVSAAERQWGPAPSSDAMASGDEGMHGISR